MTELTFYGGVGEVGGNKVLLEDKNVKVSFDSGQPFTLGTDYFTGWLAPRVLYGLKDYFEFDLMPRIKGLYSERQLQYTDLPYSEPEVDAETGVAYKVPTREVLERGLWHEDLKKYPKWKRAGSGT